MDISWLKDLNALAECKNFSRAAERRNITQPAFSRRIRALERWIGTSLVDRASHRIELTPAGEKFQRAATEILQRLYQGRQEALDAHAAASSLRFASTHALSLTFFPEWLRQIEQEISSRTVRLIADSMDGCERIMLQGEAHFLLCHHHPAAVGRLRPESFHFTRLGGDLLVPVSARDAHGNPRYRLPGSPDDPVPYLAFSKESGLGRIITAVRAQSGLVTSLKPVFTSHMAIVLKMFATEGRGLTWSPMSLVGRDLTEGGPLARAGGEEWDIPIDIWLLRPRARLDARAEAFWLFLKEREQLADSTSPGGKASRSRRSASRGVQEMSSFT